MNTLVNDVEGLRIALGVTQIAVVGHSFGGVLAPEYAVRYPDRVSHLILVSTPSDVPASALRRVSYHGATRDGTVRAPPQRDTGSGGCGWQSILCPLATTGR